MFNIQLTKPITYEEFNAVSKSLANNKATGPDKLPQECYKYAPKCVKQDLVELLNTCIHCNDIPEEWKKGRVFTIHKGGATNEAANYRPITLLNTGYKVIAAILTHCMASSLEEAKMWTDAQAGSRKNRSCKLHIKTLINTIEDAQMHNKEIHVLYLDAVKAFDSVPFWAIE